MAGSGSRGGAFGTLGRAPLVSPGRGQVVMGCSCAEPHGEGRGWVVLEEDR